VVLKKVRKSLKKKNQQIAEINEQIESLRQKLKKTEMNIVECKSRSKEYLNTLISNTNEINDITPVLNKKKMNKNNKD